MVFEINILTMAVMAVLGGLGAYLANQNIAVFHDGLRPLIPQYLQGSMDRKSLFSTSFALSFGLIIGFGIPISIVGRIMIANTVMLGSDVIGLYFLDDKKGKWLAMGSGALFGLLLLFGMEAIINLIGLFPINFSKELALVGDLIIISFSVFPSIALGYQSGVKTGGLLLISTVLLKQLLVKLNIGLDSDMVALAFGIIIMLMVTLKQNKKSESNSAGAFTVFSKNIEKIKENMVILAISGGLVAMATTLLLIGEGPASLILAANGQYLKAAMVAFIRILGFIPLVMTTSIISGVYSPAGTKAIHIPALLLINMGLIGLVGSFVIGALIMVIEILLLGFIATAMDKVPAMKELGDNTRSAMSKVIDLSLLVGGMLAANTIAPAIGFIWVMGLYFLNEVSKKPLSATAIGPIGAITMGLIVNLLHLIGL